MLRNQMTVREHVVERRCQNDSNFEIANTPNDNLSFILFLFQFIVGKMKGIAFIKDPDGYWIEIFDLKLIGNVTTNAA